jgi:hypothetical protein
VAEVALAPGRKPHSAHQTSGTLTAEPPAKGPRLGMSVQATVAAAASLVGSADPVWPPQEVSVVTGGGPNFRGVFTGSASFDRSVCS